MAAGSSLPNGQAAIEPRGAAFYRCALTALDAAGVPYLVGGAYAFAHYTGIHRHTNDLDVFLRPSDAPAALDALERVGYATELTFPHWLGKAFCGGDYVDIIFSAGNGVARVDNRWFERAPRGEVLGMAVKLCPPEEMIWQKAFVMERERYDGADVAHLLLACGERLDWPHLLARFDEHWRVLLSHLVLFGFSFPSERGRIPSWVMHRLCDRLFVETTEMPPADRVCQGTLLSREQYLLDVHRWGYEDARLRPDNPMTHEHVRQWTEAIADGR